jgi:saccharopine dehydrogenase-like NADP-dependent oxidoreductase
MKPFRVIVIGGGRVGSALAAELKGDAAFSVAVVDGVPEVVDLARAAGFEAHGCDVFDEIRIAPLLRGADVVVAAVPERLVAQVARLAERLGIHHLDFSDPRATGVVRREASVGVPAVLPGCGVSPGLVDDIVEELLSRFDRVDDLVVRVGAIPTEPVGRLGYGAIWDVDGLISEYTRPAEGFVDGQEVRLPALSGYETFEWNGRTYEAFVTANGLRSLTGLGRGRVATATFKTIRHPGHLDHMLFLLDELRLRSRLDMLANLLRNALPETRDDMVLIHVTARGHIAGRPSEQQSVHEIPSSKQNGDRLHSALARGAAAYAKRQIEALSSTSNRRPHPVAS